MSNTKTENKKVSTETPKLKKPKLFTKKSNHYNAVWFKIDLVTLTEGKDGKQFYLVDLEGNKLLLGLKSHICESKDGLKVGFHIQNSREYRIWGTSEMLTGEDIIQYQIQLNQFNQQESKSKEK